MFIKPYPCREIFQTLSFMDQCNGDARDAIHLVNSVVPVVPPSYPPMKRSSVNIL